MSAKKAWSCTGPLVFLWMNCSCWPLIKPEWQLATPTLTRWMFAPYQTRLMSYCSTGQPRLQICYCTAHSPISGLLRTSKIHILLHSNVKGPIFDPFSDLDFNPAEQPYMINDLNEVSTDSQKSAEHCCYTVAIKIDKKSDITDIIVLSLRKKKQWYGDFCTIWDH